ncbi:MAG: hypothetical protein KC502_17240 [Myxococcales bacterium]|nr:hypothetical protein [Myxococcales bacterium]
MSEPVPVVARGRLLQPVRAQLFCRRWLGMAALLGMLALPTASVASEGDHELWAGVAVTETPKLGAALRYRYAFTDFWAIGAALQHRRDLDGAHESAGLGEVRLTIDALTWVPSIAVGVGAAMAGGADPALMARVAGELAYRPARDWALSVQVGVEQLQDVPRLYVGFSYGWLRTKASDLDF